MEIEITREGLDEVKRFLDSTAFLEILMHSFNDVAPMLFIEQTLIDAVNDAIKQMEED